MIPLAVVELSEAAFQKLKSMGTKDKAIARNNIKRLTMEPTDGRALNEDADDFSPTQPHSMRHLCKEGGALVVYRFSGCDSRVPADTLLVEQIKPWAPM